jgi:hypothetical protein
MGTDAGPGAADADGAGALEATTAAEPGAGAETEATADEAADGTAGEAPRSAADVVGGGSGVVRSVPGAAQAASASAATQSPPRRVTVSPWGG